MPHTLTPDIIAAAIEGFEAQKRRIDEQIAELRAMVTGTTGSHCCQANCNQRKEEVLRSLSQEDGVGPEGAMGKAA